MMMMMSWCWVVVASARDVIALRDGISFARLARLCTGSGRRRGCSCCWVGQCTMPDLVLFHAVPYTFRSRILYHILHLQQSRQLSNTWANRPSLSAGKLLKLTRLFFDPKMGTYDSLLGVLQRRQTLHWPTQPPFVYVHSYSPMAKKAGCLSTPSIRYELHCLGKCGLDSDTYHQ